MLSRTVSELSQLIVQISDTAFSSTLCWLRDNVRFFPVFTVLHGMQTRSSDENSVCASVRLSVRHTREL